MNIDLKKITIKEVSNGYINNDEEGVVGFGGVSRAHCTILGRLP